MTDNSSSSQPISSVDVWSQCSLKDKMLTVLATASQPTCFQYCRQVARNTPNDRS